MLGRNGTHNLVTDRITGLDPLLVFGTLAAQSLRRLDGFANAGDLTVIGPFDEATGEVVSYENLVGSHGGLGGWQGKPFMIHPLGLPIAGAPLIGATAVHAQLQSWQKLIRATPDNGHPLPGHGAGLPAGQTPVAAAR